MFLGQVRFMLCLGYIDISGVRLGLDCVDVRVRLSLGYFDVPGLG